MSAHLLIGWQGVRARPGRALLTGLSLVVAVLALVAVSAAATGVRAGIVFSTAQTEGLEALVGVDLQPQALTAAQVGHFERLLEARLLSDSAQPVILAEVSASMVRGSVNRPLQLEIVYGPLPKIRGFRLIAGSWPADRRSAALAPPIAVTPTVPLTTLGDVVHLTAQPGEIPSTGVVQAVVDDGAATPTVYVSGWSSAFARPEFTTASEPSLIVHTPVAEVASVEQTVQETADALGVPLAGPPARTDDYASLDHAVSEAKLAFFGMSLIALAVAVVGILNIGLATVKERAEEFALRRALGAEARDVALIVLSESLIVAVLAAVASVAVAAIGFELAMAHFLEPTTATHAPGFPWAGAALACATAFAATLVGASVPALRAARQPIAVVMRA